MDASTQRFYYKQNRLKQLRAFYHAAKAGSITKAAERLYLSQPSVSLQIRALEQELQATLFERRGTGVELTPEGRTLYEIASPLVEGLDRLPDAFATRCGDVDSGEIDIAAGESTILYILPAIVKRFSEKYPGIRIRLHNVTGREGLRHLRAGRVDFAVGPVVDIPPDIAYRPIFSYDTVLIAPRGHPLANRPQVRLEDIGAYGLILPPRHLNTWRMVDLVFEQHGVAYRVTLEAGGWEVIKKYVELGLGISIVTSICLTGGEELCAMPLDRYFPKRTYGVVLKRGKFLSPAARRFIETMDPRFFEDRPAPRVTTSLQAK